jgi:hypothetical protein
VVGQATTLRDVLSNHVTLSKQAVSGEVSIPTIAANSQGKATDHFSTQHPRLHVNKAIWISNRHPHLHRFPQSIAPDTSGERPYSDEDSTSFEYSVNTNGRRPGLPTSLLIYDTTGLYHRQCVAKPEALQGTLASFVQTRSLVERFAIPAIKTLYHPNPRRGRNPSKRYEINLSTIR